MKRSALLIPLSHDHQHALACALRLRRASELPSIDERRAGIDAFLDFVQEQTLAHFTEEEQLLSGIMDGQASPSLRSMYERMESEHEQLRQQFSTLRASQESAPADLMRSVGAALTGHIRFEERELFETIQHECSM